MRAVARFLTDIAVAATLFVCALIVMNVALRGLGLGALPDMIHFVEEAMVFAVVLPLAMVTIRRAHICVTLISGLMPRRAQAALAIASGVFGAAAALPLIWAAYGALVSDWQSGAYAYGDLNLPRWPGRLVFLLGLGGMVIWLVRQSISDLLGRSDPLESVVEDC